MSIDLEAINAAHQAATPGEWEVSVSQVCSEDTICALWPGEMYAHSHAQWQGNAASIAALHNHWPAVYAEMLALREELAGWRHEREMTLTAFAHVRDGGDPGLIGHPGGSEFGDALRGMLAARDARMKREGAAEWLEVNIDATEIMETAVSEMAVPVFDSASKDFMRAEIERLKGGE